MWLFCSQLAAAAQLPRCVPAEGEPWPAKLVGVDEHWQLRFVSDDQPGAVAAAELVCWGTPREPRRGPLLLLADGGLLVAEVVQANGETLSAESAVFGTVQIPVKWLAAVVFQLPASPAACERLLDRLAETAGHGDRLILQNGDELPGLLLSIQEDRVRLQASHGPLELETQRIKALVFNPELRQRKNRRDFHVWVGFREGSCLLVSQMVLDASSLRITVLDGRSWSAGSPAALVFLQPLGGKVVYLSDMEPADYRHVPFLSLPWPFRLDRNAAGGLLRSGGRLYLKGIGMYSAARLTYRLPQSYRRFQAELAIDDAAHGLGSVRYRLRVDGQIRYISETVRGGQPPVRVDVDIAGGKVLDLVVDYADRFDELDYADWLNARLIK